MNRMNDQIRRRSALTLSSDPAPASSARSRAVSNCLPRAKHVRAGPVLLCPGSCVDLATTTRVNITKHSTRPRRETPGSATATGLRCRTERILGRNRNRLERLHCVCCRLSEGAPPFRGPHNRVERELRTRTIQFKQN